MRKSLTVGALVATTMVVTVGRGPAPAQAAGPVPVRAAAVAPKRVDTWAFCGVRPDDPSAQDAADSMARYGGITATFGPCNAPAPGTYTPVNPGTRYVDPATYRRLVDINAQAGMKTVVYDARIYSHDPAVRTTAIAFWTPVLSHIAAWDLGDEYDPNSTAPLNAPTPGEWTVLKQRWIDVRTQVQPITGVPPYVNHRVDAVEKALLDLPGSDQLLSFDLYGGDRGVSVARSLDARVHTVMCAVNAYTHLVFTPTPDSIRGDFADLIEAGCDRFLVFGGERVYDTTDFGPSSLVDRLGAPTSWAAAVLEGSGRSSFEPVGPSRLLETRPGLPTVDGQAAGSGVRAGGSTTELQVTGRAGVRKGAGSASLNVTVTNAAAPGFVTVYPCDAPRPLAAQVNFPARTDLASAVEAKLSADGRVCLFTPVDTDLVVDVNGFHPDGAAFTPLQPGRLLETRTLPDLSTVDGRFLAAGPSAAASVTTLQVAGRGGVPEDATEAVLDVTVTGPAGPGFVTVFPCDQPRPTASHLNYAAGATVTNAVVAALDASGRTCLFTLAPTDLVVDVNAFVPARSPFVSLPPSRLLETRPESGFVTVDGQQANGGLRGAGATTVLPVAGRAGIPATARAVVLNLTVTAPTQTGFVTVWPCGRPRPTASNINFKAGATVANLVSAELGDGGAVCLFTSAPTHLVVDVTSYHP